MYIGKHILKPSKIFESYKKNPQKIGAKIHIGENPEQQNDLKPTRLILQNCYFATENGKKAQSHFIGYVQNWTAYSDELLSTTRAYLRELV